MKALLEEENTNASRNALRSWLPPPAELLRIAEYDKLPANTAFPGRVESLVALRAVRTVLLLIYSDHHSVFTTCMEK